MNPLQFHIVIQLNLFQNGFSDSVNVVKFISYTKEFTVKPFSHRNCSSISQIITKKRQLTDFEMLIQKV